MTEVKVSDRPMTMQGARRGGLGAALQPKFGQQQKETMAIGGFV